MSAWDLLGGGPQSDASGTGVVEVLDDHRDDHRDDLDLLDADDDADDADRGDLRDTRTPGGVYDGDDSDDGGGPDDTTGPPATGDADEPVTRPRPRSRPAPGDSAGAVRGRVGAALARLRAAVFDQLPLTGQRVAVGLGRHWWLPVVVAVAALALGVGAVVRARPSSAAPLTHGAAAPLTHGAAPATTAGTAPTAAPGVTPIVTPDITPGVVAGVATAPGSGGTAAAASPARLSPASGASGISVAPGEASGATAAGGVGHEPVVVGVVVVDVVGRVRRPGVVRLPRGARVVDALRVAGGAVPGTDVTKLDLAQPLTDGTQVRVGLAGPPIVGPAVPGVPAGSGPVAPDARTGTTAGVAGSAAATSSAQVGVVNLDTASAEQLDTLPGIGPVLAQRIVAWRTAHGPFSTVDDLDEVSGIGTATLAKLRGLLTVGP